MANQNQQKVPDLVPINGSTNVYVGQRYVPKFYDDGTEQHGATWDKTKAYEPLTIVLWEGDSYTSRTFVPAGVEINNTNYWLRTGLFNAQLEAIRTETGKVDADIKALKDNVFSNNYRYAKMGVLIVDNQYNSSNMSWAKQLKSVYGNARVIAYPGSVISGSVYNAITTADVDWKKINYVVIGVGADDANTQATYYNTIRSYITSQNPYAQTLFFFMGPNGTDFKTGQSGSNLMGFYNGPGTAFYTGGQPTVATHSIYKDLIVNFVNSRNMGVIAYSASSEIIANTGITINESSVKTMVSGRVLTISGYIHEIGGITSQNKTLIGTISNIILSTTENHPFDVIIFSSGVAIGGILEIANTGGNTANVYLSLSKALNSGRMATFNASFILKGDNV